MARSSCGGVAICYVHLVLRVTSCSPTIGQAKATKVGASFHSDSPGAERDRERSVMPRAAVLDVLVSSVA